MAHHHCSQRRLIVRDTHTIKSIKPPNLTAALKTAMSVRIEAVGINRVKSHIQSTGDRPATSQPPTTHYDHTGD